MSKKIPDHAKRVFKGTIFDIYQWEQKLYDGTKGIFESAKRENTVIVIPVTEDKKIIYAHQEQPDREPYLSFISGRGEEGEDPKVTAKRELLEETGYEPKDIILLHSYRPHNKIDWTIYTFIARGCKKVADQTLDPGEKIELKFADLDEFLDLVATQKLHEVQLTIKVLEAKLDPTKMQDLKSLLLN